MRMFGRKKRTTNGIMMSLIGLGVGAAAFGMVKKRNRGNGNNALIKPMKNPMDGPSDPVI